MKVVINQCFGGFGLSLMATVRMLQAEPEALSACSLSEWTRDNGTEFRPIEGVDGIRQVGQVGRHHEHWWSDVVERDSVIYRVGDGQKMRTSPTLIALVEKGDGSADGPNAKLGVVEIPDNINWEISEYDGNETVEESHRRWS